MAPTPIRQNGGVTSLSNNTHSKFLKIDMHT